MVEQIRVKEGTIQYIWVGDGGGGLISFQKRGLPGPRIKLQRWPRHAKCQDPGNLVPEHFSRKILTFFRKQRFVKVGFDIYKNICSCYY